MAASAAPALAQRDVRSEVRIRVVEESLAPVPARFLTLRAEGGQQIVPNLLGDGSFAARVLGRKVWLEFIYKQAGAKAAPIPLVLEAAPLVDVTVCIDPESGRVKSISQKPIFPTGKNKLGARKTGGGGGQALLLVPPSNDPCATPAPLLLGLNPFDTTEATTDGPAHCAPLGKDVWYSFTAPSTGALTVSTCVTTGGSATFDTMLAVYSGLGCPPVTPIGCLDDSLGPCGATTTLTVALTGGLSYLVRLGGFGSASGTGVLSATFSGPPANDECAGAIDVPCNSTTVLDNSVATVPGTDPDPSCSVIGVGSMWYTFMATGANATIDTIGSAVSDTILAVYDGSCGSLVEIGCDDDGAPTALHSLVSLAGLTPGNTYIIRVASFSASHIGSITLNVACAAGPPPGDSCDDPLPIACGSSVSFDNSTFTTEPSDPEFSCHASLTPTQGEGSAWLTFVATSTEARIDTNALPLTDTLLAVYDGTCGAFTELACSEDEGVGFESELCVAGLTVGNTYYIQVGSFFPSDQGPITVNLECPCPKVANDDCANAIAAAVPSSHVVDTTLATTDVVPCDENDSGPFRNVWYEVAGTGNLMRASTCNAGTVVSDTRISVFCADCGALVCVSGNDDDAACGAGGLLSTAEWCSQAGASYLVTVGTWSDFTFPGVIQLDIADTGEDCDVLVSCLPQGGCCLPDGSCVVTTQGDCAAQGGAYQGDDTVCTTNAVADPSFEAGPFGGVWTESSTNFGTPICNAPFCGGTGGGTGPITGSHWAWFGGFVPPSGVGVEEGTLEQLVTIATDASTLDFFLEIPVSSGNGSDFLEVLIDGVQVFEVLESAGTGPGYGPVSIPLGAFADGGVHTLTFHSIQTGEAPDVVTNFFVEDVSISSSAIDCIQCFTVDFETEDDSTTPIVNGQALADEFGAFFDLSSEGANLGPVAFDSTPGGPNDPAINDDMLIGHGNVLLLQHSSYPTQSSPGVFAQPTDDNDGGALVFDFVSPIEAISMLLADINPPPNQGATVVLTDGVGRRRVYDIEPGWTGTYGDAGPHLLDLTTLAPQPGNGTPRRATATEDANFDPDDVVRIVVHLTGFGGVDELTFCK
jgi:hypothetical protein